MPSAPASLAVAVNVVVMTSSGARTTAASTVLVPSSGPSVSVAEARPSGSVKAESGVTVPPPAVASKRTHTPSTPSSSGASTRATSGSGKVDPRTPVCPLPDSACTTEGTGRTSSVTAVVSPVSNSATISTGPRSVPARISPTARLGTVARSGSSDRHAIGVPGMGSPSSSSAMAVSSTVSAMRTLGAKSRITTSTASDPGPTYSSSTSTIAGSPVVAGDTVTGPPSKATVPSGVRAAIVSVKVSPRLVSATRRVRSSESPVMATVESFTMLLSATRRRVRRTESMGTILAAALANHGATPK